MRASFPFPLVDVWNYDYVGVERFIAWLPPSTKKKLIARLVL